MRRPGNRQAKHDRQGIHLFDGGRLSPAQFANAEDFAPAADVPDETGLPRLAQGDGPCPQTGRAIQAVNAVSVLLLASCLVLWMWRGFLQGALLLMPLLALSGFVMTARLGTPDLLAAALTVGRESCCSAASGSGRACRC